MCREHASIALRKPPRRTANTLARIFLFATFAFVAACGDSIGNAQKHLEAAKSLQAEGKYRSAVIELKNALQANPNLAEARWLLGQTYLVTGEGAGALKEFRQAERLGFTDPDLELVLARALLVSGEYHDALITAVMHPARATDNRWLILEGDALLALERNAAAAEAFSRVIELDPANAEARRGLARASIQTGETGAARNVIDKALEASARDLEALVLKGELELAERRPEAAAAAFRDALAIDAAHSAASVGLARALLAAGALDEASPLIARALQQRPRDAGVLFLNVSLARQRNDMTATAKAATELLAVRPDHAPTLMLLAEVHILRREFQLAEERLRVYLAGTPGDPRARRLLGTVLLELGRFSDALDVLHEAERSAPSDPALLTTLGRAYLSVGEHDKAQAYLDRAAELAPAAVVVQTEAAMGHLVGGSPEEAVAILESVLAQSPDFPRAEVLLVVAHLRAGDFDNAVSAALGIAEKRPERHEAQNLLALAYEAAGRHEDARAAYARSLQITPANRAAVLNLARMDLAAGHMQEAKAGFEQVLQDDPDNATALVALAMVASAEGRTVDSVTLLEQARARHPGAVRPRVVLAGYYLRQNHRSEALAVAQEAVRAAPEHATARFLLARVLLANRQPAKAIPILDDLAKTAPESTELLFQLAVAHGQAGAHEQTRAALQRVMELDPQHLRARTALAGLALATGDIDAALAQARELQAGFPDNAQGYLLEADALMARGESAAALSLYERAHGIDPSSTSLLKLADARRFAGDTQGADRLVDDWLGTRPDDIAVRLARATRLHAAGAHDAAVDDYERVLQRSPDNTMALNNLAWLYHDREDPRAVELARKAYDTAPENADVLDTYGWLLVAGNSVERGLPLLEKATAGAPGNPGIVYHYAAALARADESERAAQLLDVLLSVPLEFSNRNAARRLRESLRAP